jgi:uncharacterized repeat protein (TIGR01451 family)
VSDSNDCSNPLKSTPHAAYVGFKVTNNTGSTQSDLQATITGFSSGFSLTQNGSQPQTQYIGTLANNASRTVYWHFQYPCHTNKNTDPPAPSNTFTVTVNNAKTSALIDSATGTVTSNSSIRANAGGLIDSATLGAGAVLGQIITYDVKYSFGNVQNGDRFNIQPAGNINFRSDCFQLLSTRVTSSDVNAIPINTVDQLFYQSTVSQGGSGNLVSIRYFFLYLCNGVTSSASPYSSQTSGSNNLKYSGNFGAAATIVSFPAATNSFSITKTATPNSLTNGGTVTYTITVKNNSPTFDARIDRITDVLPTGVTFGSTVTSLTGTVSAPANGDTGTIKWLSQSPNFFEIKAGQSVQLVYTATIPNTNGTYTNSAKAGFGLGETSPATINVIVAPPSDYGDAPNSFGNASHVIPTTPNVYLGNTPPDQESGTQLGSDAGATAAGDDGNGTDDEDAFTTLANVSTVGNYNLTVPVTNTSGNPATLHAWIDFDKDGEFEAGEHKSATVANGDTSASLKWAVPVGTLPGSTHARFRLTTDTLTDLTGTTFDDRSIGNASNGEVEDYPVTISTSLYDYGDAPDGSTGTGAGNYQTTASDGGAAQVKINVAGQVLSLGSNIDTDDGSLQDINAQADDTSGTDDEDGVSSFPVLTTTAAQTYVVPVSVQNNVLSVDAYLAGYIDFNKDGDFNDTGEKSTTTVTVPSSTTNPRTFNVTFTTPAGMTTGNTYARFRLGQVKTTVESATGVSASTDNGEIEDYQIAIAPAPPVPTSVTSTCTAPETLVSPSAFTLNSANYALNTALQNSVPSILPLSLYNGTMRFNATLSPNAAWEDGVRLKNDASFGNHLFLQPKNTNNYLNTGNKATYEFLFPSGVKNLSMVVGGLNNYDGTTIMASYQGTLVPISAANFSNLSTGMTLSDTNVDIDSQVDTVVSSNTTGGVEVTNNFYTLTIPNLIDKLTVVSGKDEINNNSTATVGFSLIGYCANFDYGDAPDSYGTDKTANNSNGGSGTDPVGARHGITSTLKFGTNAPDAETDATTPLNGTGDGTDEDGITTFPSLNINNSSYTLSAKVNNTTGSAANVYGWIDFDGDGKFDGDERATVNNGAGVGAITLDSNGKVPNNSDGNVTLTWSNLGGTGANINSGNTYARIRLTTDTLAAASVTTARDSASVTTASDGEVEDYQVAIAQALDYGDAPDTYGTNSTNNNGEGVGANHLITNALKLGANAPDAETDAQTPLDGTGDGADEDAFTTLANVPTIGNYKLTVPVINNSDDPATLHAWIDFDRDGKFEAGEYQFATVAVNATSVSLSWAVPSGMTPGDTYARFRLTSTPLSDNTSTNLQDERSVGAANDGEVEDYPVTIAANTNPNLSPDFCQASASRNLLFILDDSGSVTGEEVQQQRDAVMATLNSFVAKGLTGQAAIVGFDGNSINIIGYTNIISANLTTFKNALDSYGTPSGATSWEAGFQAGTALGVNQPDAVFFFTDGIQNAGDSPEDEATQFKNAGAHIFGIGIELTINDGFKHITDGEDSVIYNGSNILEADYVDIDDYASLQTQYTNDFLANLCAADFGDAPDTYGTNFTASDSSNNSDPVGANHRILAGLYLGAKTPDPESNGFVDGTDDHTNATDDDEPLGTGTGNGDDEGNFSFPTLSAGKTSYQIPAANITVTNTATPAAAATLHAWIDFDQNGTFDPLEHASVTVNSGTTGGNPTGNLTWSNITIPSSGDTYARFRLTRDNLINNATPGGAASSGEVEDYQIAIATVSDPNLLLVKRITAINPGKPEEILFNNFVDDSGTTNDNDPLWPNPNVYLRGAIDAGKVKPGDEVEYTVYFLSNGDGNAKEVKICDVVPDHMTFIKNTYGVELGIGLGLDPAALPTDPNLELSNLLNDDQGDFYGPGTTPPANLCKKVNSANALVNVDGTNNDNGAVVVKIPDLPKANTPGNPMDSYGFIRFRAKVK